MEAVSGASRPMADACAERHKPFWAVIHRGGERMLHWKQLHRIVRHARELADRRGIDWKGHIATNESISVDQANWIAAQRRQLLRSFGSTLDGSPRTYSRFAERRSSWQTCMPQSSFPWL